MVALVEKRRPGRPKKYEDGAAQFTFTMPRELRIAVEKFRDDRGLLDLSECVRSLLREGAEARGLIQRDRRK